MASLTTDSTNSFEMIDNNDDEDDNEYSYSFRNSPPNLVGAFKHFADSTLSSCVRSLRLSIDNVDIDSAMFCIKLLSSYLELKYPITMRDRASLCRLCLILLFEFPTDLMQQILVIVVCTKLIKNENLSRVGLVLKWRAFYNLLLCTHYSSQNGSIQCDSSSILRSHYSKLLGLIGFAKSYFDCSSFAQILDCILPFLNPNDVLYHRYIHLLSIFIPTKQLWIECEILKYVINSNNLIIFLLDQLFTETLWIEGSPQYIISILINIIKYNPSFSLLLRDSVSKLFHLLYLSAQLPINGKMCILKVADRFNNISFNKEMLSSLIQLLVYLMNNDGDNDEVQLLFIHFFKNTLNYFYPQENTRSTSFSVKLTSILSSFALNYTKRYWRELRGFNNNNCVSYKDIPIEIRKNIYSWHSHLNKKHPFYREIDDKYKLCISHKLFDQLIPIIKWSIYAKSPFIQFGGYSAIKLLCSIFAQKGTEWGIKQCKECLSAITASHRLSIGCALLDCITPTLLNRHLLPAAQPIFIESIKQILFGIDPSLNKQCTLTMAYLNQIFNKIAIIKYDKTITNNDDDDNIGIESTLHFEQFALSFVDKILKYARDSSLGLDTLKTSGSSAHTPGIKNFVPRSNRILLKKFSKCIYAFWFAVSKDIYIKCRDKVLDIIIDEPQCGELSTVIIKGMIHPYPQLSLHLILDKVINKILSKKKNILRGSKEVLTYYLSLIEAAIVPSHSYIIKYIPTISNIITICMHNPLPEIKKFAGPLLQSIVVTLTRETPLEMRPFSPHIWKEDGSWKHWEYWGQFTEIEMKGLYKTWRPNLRLKWFYPKEEEFNAIQRLIDNVLSDPLKQIKQFIINKTNTLSAEQLLQYIRVLYHFCYGIGHLGDFDVDEHSSLLPTVCQDNYFINTSSSYFQYRPSKDLKDKIYGSLNKLRSMLKLPHLEEYHNVSLRTAFTRLCIKLYRKLSEYSDTADYIIDKSELPEDEQQGDNDTEMSDTSFSNINIRDILEIESDSDNTDDKERIKRSSLFPGVSKVLVWLNTFVNILMNHDGVMWGVVSNLSASGYAKILRKMFGEDIFTGHIHNHRAAYVHEAHALTLKRLYFLFSHNSYTTDVRSLVEELAKCSISEFQNVRNQAIHAIISGRSIYNFRSAIDWCFRFWLKIIRDNKSQKCQLLGATKALNHTELITQIILATSQRDREFITALLSGSIHREPAVQSSIYQIFFKYFKSKKYRTIYIPSNIVKNKERKKEIEIINENLKKEHQLIQKQLLYIAKNEKINDNDSNASSSGDSSSFIKVPLMPNDPVVASVSSLISNLDLDSLNIDLSSFDINHVTPQSLSTFLSKQGFTLPSSMFQSLSLNQLQSIVDSSKLSKFIKQKAEPSSSLSKLIKKEKKTVNVHWKYQLMATILLWKSLRPNIAPNIEVIEYILKLIGNEIPSLNRVAVSALNTIIHSYLPLLHYKDILKNPSDYPIEHSFGWVQCHQNTININDLCISKPLYMRPKAQLPLEAASMIHEYLSNNLDILCKAFASDHPNITDPSAPVQSRRSSDTQLKKLIRLPFAWPYDGYDVTLDSWEHTHYLLMRDLLRCKWPNSKQDTESTNWSYDENLWNMAIDQFNVYGKNTKEKEHQLAAGEILSGILRAYHHFAAIHQLPTDITTQLLSTKITQPLLKIMQQCPQESEDAWCCAIRSGLANSDPNNIEWFTHPILMAVVSNIQVQHIDNDTEDGDTQKQVYISPDKQVRAMRYGTEILVSYGYRGEKQWRYILSSLTKPCSKIAFNDEYKESKDDIDHAVFDCYFSNIYRPVRGDIGILLAHIVRCLRTKPSPSLSIYDVTTIDPQFTAILSIIETQYLLLWEKQHQEQIEKQQKHGQSKEVDIYTKKYDNFLQTLCFWLLQCYNTSNMIYYQSLFARLLPLILCGAYREDKKTLEVVSMTKDVIAWTCFHEEQVLAIFDILLDLNRKPRLINNGSWKLRKVVLEFLLQFICRNAVILNKNEEYLRLITDYLIDTALRDKQLEVGVTARNVLTALIQCTNMKDPDHITALQARFEKFARTKIPKRNYEKEQNAAFNKKLNIKLRKKHCGVLGLSSLILSVPYTCPDWLPEILSFVSVFDRERAPIGSTAKKTVAEFKRTHQDEWHIFKKEFTLEQLSNIQDASSTSYFV